MKRIALSLILSLPLCVQAKLIKVGLYDNASRIYLTANQSYEIIEDRSEEQGSFDAALKLLEKKPKEISLLRSSPGTANDLVIAAQPQLLTSSSHIKFRCLPDKAKKIRIAKFSSKTGELELENSPEKSKPERPCIFSIREAKHQGMDYGKFRGSLIVIPQHEHFTLINELDIEDYLKGVLPSEMPSSWEIEALKSQAIAARTYTYKNLGRRHRLGYDLKSSVEDQRYQGYNRETKRTNQAQEATEGLILTNAKSGAIVKAFYSAHSGAYSASPEDGWGLRPENYLVQVREPSQAMNWKRSFSFNGLSKKLEDLRLNKIEDVVIADRSLEGRATKVLVKGSYGYKLLTGEEFRHKLGLRSTLFSLEKKSNKIFLEGNGFGHGIGMSQHGARALAKKGFGFKDILAYFYRGSKLKESTN